MHCLRAQKVGARVERSAPAAGWQRRRGGGEHVVVALAGGGAPTSASPSSLTADSSLADLWIMTALVSQRLSHNNDDATCMRELIERLATAEHN